MFLHLELATEKVTDRMIDHAPYLASYLMRRDQIDVALASSIPLKRVQGFAIDLCNMSLPRAASLTKHTTG